MAGVPESDVVLTTDGKIAIITLNIPQKLNALTQAHYFRIATLLREVAERDDIYITVITGKGRFFSAGADISASLLPSDGPTSDRYLHAMRGFVTQNLDVTRTFYTHPKILVTALNGPAVGLSAALIAHSDFIWAAPSAYLLTPFSSLGLVAEGASSMTFVERLGITKANEALIMSKRITAEEMLAAGFVNGIVDVGTKSGAGEDAFLKEVLREVKERLGDHLVGESLLKTKELIQRPRREQLEKQNVHEVFAGLERLMSGRPSEEFRKIKSGEKKHKL